MNRTNWKFSSTNINILTLGIIYEGIAFPIAFKMMDKRGNSNTEERMELIQRFISFACFLELRRHTLPYQNMRELS